MCYPEHENLKNSRVYVLVMSMLLSFFPAMASAQEILTVEQAVQQVVADSPRLAAKMKQSDALREVAPQVSSLPDPVVSLNALSLPINSFSNTQESMTQWQVGITQAVPALGKLSLRADIADQVADMARFDSDELRLKLIERVRTRWWNLFYLDHATSTVLRNQDLLRQLIRVAETKYKVGEGLQQDVLLAQVELSKLLDVAIQLKSARKQEEARLNELLHQAPNQPIVLPSETAKNLASLEDESRLFQYALHHRPILARETLRIESMGNRVLLAEEDYKPDFKLGAAYGLRNGHNPNGSSRADLFSVGVSMTMPWFTKDKQDHQLQQRQAELAQAQFQYDDAKDAVLSDISRARSAYAQAKEQSMLFKQGIIPQSKQTLASMRAAYQVNKVDFLNLVRAQITLYNYETQYWKVFAQAKQSLARLNRAMGKEPVHE